MCGSCEDVPKEPVERIGDLPVSQSQESIVKVLQFIQDCVSDAQTSFAC